MPLPLPGAGPPGAAPPGAVPRHSLTPDLAEEEETAVADWTEADARRATVHVNTCFAAIGADDGDGRFPAT